MTYEEKVTELKRMLRRCPEILTPSKINRWSPLGKNKVYELIKSGELKSIIYQNAYIVCKDDLIDYLARHSEDDIGRRFKIGG